MANLHKSCNPDFFDQLGPSGPCHTQLGQGNHAMRGDGESPRNIRLFINPTLGPKLS